MSRCLLSAPSPNPFPRHAKVGSSYSSDSVGLAAVGDGGGLRAVGGVLVDDLSDDGDVLGPGVGANGSSDESSGVLHFVGLDNSKVGVD